MLATKKYIQKIVISRRFQRNCLQKSTPVAVRILEKKFYDATALYSVIVAANQSVGGFWAGNCPNSKLKITLFLHSTIRPTIFAINLLVLLSKSTSRIKTTKPFFLSFLVRVWIFCDGRLYSLTRQWFISETHPWRYNPFGATIGDERRPTEGMYHNHT